MPWTTHSSTTSGTVYSNAPIHRLRLLGVFGLLLALAAGCGPSEQTPAAESSGFLGDYSQLQPGRADQAQLVYINPQADFSSYENVIVDPVVVWEGKGSDLSDVPPEELQSLARDLGTAMREQLAFEFRVVEQPEPGTLRIRIAIVEAKRSSAGSGSAFEGSVGIELEVLDAGSSERLVAVTDSRGHEGEQPGSSSAGTDARAAFDDWAGRARDRLSAFRRFDAARAGLDEALEP